ncbi:MAG: nucleotidyl transferase [Candidatus Cloacimonadota bacterium]|nr:MAG: nucleotidyl transferase [Candidatus Cloacimonadota bacterium]
MENIIAVLPVAGFGKRLRPHTLTKAKVLLTIAGKPILSYIIDELLNLPINEFIFIVGHCGKQIETFIQDNYSLNAQFVYQEEQRGLGHAVYLSKDFIEPDDDMLIILGDTLFEADLTAIIASDISLIGVKEVKDPSRFGVVQMKQDRVQNLVEKPNKPPSNLAIVGIYFIKQSMQLIQALEYTISRGITTKGEIQLTDALHYLVQQGNQMSVFKVQGWFDCGKPETLLATNRYLLEKYHHTTAIEGSPVKPPVFIGNGVTIEGSTIGPFVSISDGCIIEDTIISNSIVYDNSVIKSCNLVNSIIGSSSVVKGANQMLNIGDFSTIVHFNEERTKQNEKGD